MATCLDCGKSIGRFEKTYKVENGKVICSVCRKKPRLCSGCGAQIDRLEKHRVFKNGSFLCNACYEERKKKEDDKKNMAAKPESFSAGYKGGFGGVPKPQIVSMIIGPTQLTVESTAYLAQNRRNKPCHQVIPCEKRQTSLALRTRANCFDRYFNYTRRSDPNR